MPNYFVDEEYFYKDLAPVDREFCKDVARCFMHSTVETLKHDEEMYTRVLFNRVKQGFINFYGQEEILDNFGSVTDLPRRIFMLQKTMSPPYFDEVRDSLDLSNLKNYLDIGLQKVKETQLENVRIRFAKHRWKYPGSVSLHAPLYLKQVLLNTRKIFSSYFKEANAENERVGSIVLDLEKRYADKLTIIETDYKNKQMVKRILDRGIIYV